MTTTPTQTRYPWRAVLRTVLAVVIAAAPMVPLLVAASGLPETSAVVGGVLAIAAAVTRILAVPGVDAWLAKIGLSAAPPNRSSTASTHSHP